jgi:hypothetical protein
MTNPGLCSGFGGDWSLCDPERANQPPGIRFGVEWLRFLGPAGDFVRNPDRAARFLAKCAPEGAPRKNRTCD